MQEVAGSSPAGSTKRLLVAYAERPKSLRTLLRDRHTFATNGLVRIRQAFALVFFVALWGVVMATSASAATPVCKVGQKSTIKSPCLPQVKQKEVAPAAIDPGDVGERQGRGDAVTVITFLDIPRGLYQLSVTNPS